jgi:hypothetical protein
MELVDAIQQLTAAIRENTEALRHQAPDPKKRRDEERKTLLMHGPYDRAQLMAMKRPQLVMYAATKGVRNTSVPQAVLVDAVISAQSPNKPG